MIFEQITQTIHTDNTVLLHFSAREEINSNIIELVSFRTTLKEGPRLHRLKVIIENEFVFKYGNSHSVFLLYERFVDIINLVYAMEYNEPFYPSSSSLPLPIDPVLIDANRSRIYEDMKEAPFLPFVVEFNIFKEMGNPVSIRSIWYYEDGRECRYQEIISEINPDGMEWNLKFKKFINHPDAAIYNQHVDNYITVFKSSVAEELAEELNAIDLANRELNPFLEEDYDLENEGKKVLEKINDMFNNYKEGKRV